MTSTHTFRGLVWLDLLSPTEDEISGLVKRYGLHPLVGEELKAEGSAAKASFFKDCMMVVLTLPVRVRKGDGYEIVEREIDFVVGKNFILTVRYGAIEQVEYFAKVFDANAILSKDERIDHAGYIFYYMVKRIYGGLIQDLENMRDALDGAEDKIFKGEERRMVETLSGISRELLDIKQTARMHRDVWESMVEYADRESIAPGFASYVRDIRDQFKVIHELILNASEMLADLRETNDSLLNLKQNEIVRVLTLVTSVFIPLTFIAAIFTIPASGVPFIEGPSGWWVIGSIMAVVAIFMAWYFKKSKWV